MRKIIILCLILHSILSASQNLENSFIVTTKNDSIKFFFDTGGNVTTQKNADYFRVAFIDSTKFDYKGKIEDYMINKNQKVYECSYENGYNGEVKCYFTNGKLKYTGFFKNSLKDKEWIFYYDNGLIERKILYQDDNLYFKEYYTEKGKAVFTDGNGKYHGFIIAGPNFIQKYKISGFVKDGKMDGEWSWSSSLIAGADYFENGKYLKSYNGGLDNAPPVPRIVDLIGYIIHENVDLFKFIAIPRKKFQDPIYNYSHVESVVSFNKDSYLQPLKYKESAELKNSFINELIDCILHSNSSTSGKDYWSIIQFTVTKENDISNITIHSNIRSISNGIKQFLNNNKSFTSPKMGKNNVDCDIFLSIFYQNGKLFVPDYNFNNSNFNVFSLKPNQ